MKGISPLIASVLLLAITFTLATVLSPWALTLVRKDTQTLSNKSSSVTECNVVTIENVYLDFQNNVSRMYVLAKGDAQVVSASILNKKGVNMALANASQLPLDMSRGQRALITFNLTSALPACANYSKSVITTNCLTDETTIAEGC
ncbi:MAG: hypothetical protein HY365_03850 [Candidatus Aenigmarchaeota archaeon]|nr:hypothetical protein [Candidatus Aenigmarchaeota archaeon]